MILVAFSFAGINLGLLGLSYKKLNESSFNLIERFVAVKKKFL